MIGHIRARSDVATNVPSVKRGEYQTDPSPLAIDLLRSEKSVCTSAVNTVFFPFHQEDPNIFVYLHTGFNQKGSRFLLRCFILY